MMDYEEYEQAANRTNNNEGPFPDLMTYQSVKQKTYEPTFATEMMQKRVSITGKNNNVNTN
jgi:hypothetical protein